MDLIEFQNVSKWFAHNSGRELLRTRMLRWFGSEHRENFYALRNVSFRLARGESLGLVGSNGAGKSTILSLIAKLAQPNEGSVKVNGRIAALLELGSGFHPDLTGAENLLLNAALVGLSRKRTLELFDKIVAFSGIEEFINEPLRTYSSGMIMRLAFSIAVHTEPDILLIDEVIAVGDAAFQVKCSEALAQFRRDDRSIVLVSHSTESVRKLCDRALWIDHGEMMLEGEVSAVLAAYEGKTALSESA